MIKLSQLEAIRGEHFLSVEFSSNFDWTGCWIQLKISPTEFKGAKSFFPVFSEEKSPFWIKFQDVFKTFLWVLTRRMQCDAFAVSTKGKHSVVWRAGSCLYLSSLEIWLWGQHSIRSKIVLLIERSVCRTGYNCVCSAHVRFYLFFSALRGIVCAKGVHEFILGHSEMI